MKYFLACAILFFSVSSFCEDINIEVKKLMGWLDSANAKINATEALANGDIRLWAVKGFTLYIPSVKNEQKEIIERTAIVKKHSFRIIKGTSDALVSEEHQRLNHLAWQYAKEYNKFILANYIDDSL
ncbi:hypothetical protein [Pseudoalteromonas denitrificans]|uniref:Uncharacterized protein n=1 Tax=Pseudoalteromonas denitrificans DSM 6059 TaxID=1123010 RepID=A0A1I1H925_9GAMM|nr:hypothetical protein [Pseudoalteromonas denitrificans]SFC20341.1 hypothetical protein SAMN02745724_01109 [Pseudoalteromonas denitrificans DSM 6059]